MAQSTLTKQSNEPAIFQSLRSDRVKQELAAALPKHVTTGRMLRMAITAIRQTPALAQCTQMSTMGCLFEAAQLGLEPNTPLGHAYLLPYNDRRNNRKICTLIVGYKGLISLADRAGIMISAEVVRENDEFDYTLGTKRRIDHKPLLSGDRGKIIAAYAVAKHADGREWFRVIGMDEINRAKGASASAAKGGPWQTDEPAMVCKTAVRRLAPFLPMSPEFMKAVELDEAADRGEQADILDVPFEEVPNEPGDDEAAARELQAELQAAKEADGQATDEAPDNS